jgi:hypothetical protein
VLPKLVLAAAVVAGGAFAFKTYQEAAAEKKEPAKEPAKARLGWGKK